MVGAVDDRDVDVGLGELGDAQPPKPPPTTTTLGPPDAVLVIWISVGLSTCGTCLREEVAPLLEAVLHRAQKRSDISRTTSVCVDTSVVTQS